MRLVVAGPGAWFRTAVALVCFGIALLAGREADLRLDLWAWDRALSEALPLRAPEGEPLARAREARVLIVDVSLPSTAGEGIVDRRALARVARKLTALGAQVLAFDIQFEAGAEHPSGVSRRPESEPEPDAELGAALQSSGRAVLAAWSPAPGQPIRLSHFSAAAAAHGVVNLPVDDRDGYLRVVSHQFRAVAGTGGLASLALAVLQRSVTLPGEPPAAIVEVPDGLNVSGTRAQVFVPVDESGRSRIVYRGLAGTIPTLRWEAVLGLSRAALDLGGKTVYLGNARADIRDSYLTPFHRGAASRLSGVEVQAQELQGLIDGARWRSPGPVAQGLARAAAAAGGLALAAAFSPPAAVVAVLLVTPLLFWVALVAFEESGLLVLPFGPAVSLGLGCLAWVLVRYRQEVMLKRGLQALLSAYFQSTGTMTLAGPAPHRADSEAETTMARLMEARTVLAPAGIEILAPLGAGGMSFVLKARERVTGRLIALKLLSPDLFRDAEGRARFSQEARLAASLTHPNIVGVVRAGDETGIPYIAYEFVEGPTLRTLLQRRGKLPAGEAVRIVRQLLAGLAAAHSRGIVHRDIKPENTLMQDGSLVRILDFGIARSDLGADNVRTRTGMLLGTPTYMAPELLRDVRASASSDLYSAGCLLYELVCGRPPFTGDSPSAVLIAHLEKTPAAPSDLGVRLPPGLWESLAGVLAKDPAARPPGAEAWSDALAPFELEHISESMAPMGPPALSSPSEKTRASSAAVAAAGRPVAATAQTRRGRRGDG
ncbi:MAG: protein kinase [Candidatus Wallbacteria bacterium]|nr:protein kinase [Candidatus Wallbacteria bacterium]